MKIYEGVLKTLSAYAIILDSSDLHRLKVQFNGIGFTCPVAVADSPSVPPLLGRADALDLFDVLFSKGQEIKLRL